MKIQRRDELKQGDYDGKPRDSDWELPVAVIVSLLFHDFRNRNAVGLLGLPGAWHLAKGKVSGPASRSGLATRTNIQIQWLFGLESTLIPRYLTNSTTTRKQLLIDHCIRDVKVERHAKI